MTEDRFARLKNILLDAIELPPEQRDAYLDAACGDDATLRADAAAKLGHLGENTTILASGGLDELVRSFVGAPIPGAGAASAGRYRILDKIGEGGFGEVHLAEQLEPVRRQVALKVLKAGLDTRAVLARFEAERQTLATMSHPGIATMLDAGETDRGRPYFAMEYVDGPPITRYCDDARLSTRERLELFATVCEAVHHAHQKGVIHRDIKPSNVLVATRDGVPAVKVIDFGVAKALFPADKEQTAFTEVGQLVGTPEYMSPEQAAGLEAGIDTRTDIYSLGAMLYELLTGHRPFESAQLRAAGLESIRKTIRESEPSKPSTRVSSGAGEAISELAFRRRTSPQVLMSQLRGDLDWITMKALEKDPARRYASASEFAEDVRRFLRNDPVVARPPSALYTFQKMASRHRVAFGLATAFVTLVLGFGVWVSVLYTRANIARAEAVESRDRAETALGEAESVTQFLSTMLHSADPRQGSKDITVRQVVDVAAERIDAELTDKPLVRARLKDTMARAYMGLGSLDKARPLLEESLAIRQENLGAEHGDVGVALNNLARVLERSGEYASAESTYMRAIEVQTKAFGPDHKNVVNSMNNLGGVYRYQGRLVEARTVFERVLALREAALGPDDISVARAAGNLGFVLSELGQSAEARPLLERSIAIQEKTLGPEHPDVLQGLDLLSAVTQRLGDLEAARRHAERIVEVGTRVLGADHWEVAGSRAALASILADLGEHETADSLFRSSIATFESALGPDHPKLANAFNDLGLLRKKTGKEAEAKAYFDKALQIIGRSLGEDSPFAGPITHNIAKWHRDRGEFENAREHFERAGALLASYDPGHPYRVEWRTEYAELLRAMGDEAAAAALEAPSPAAAP